MAVRPILRYPHPVLKTPAEAIEPGPRTDAIADDLVDTMRASPACVGLAATQIGEPVRMFCLDVTRHPKTRVNHGLLVVINPVIVAGDDGDLLREGCMSLPDFTGNVWRSKHVELRGWSPVGDVITLVAEGFEARAVQHEVDHLDGMLFLDRVSSLTANLFPRKRYAR